MRTSIKVLTLLKLLSSAAAGSCDYSAYPMCTMKSIKLYSDNNCGRQVAEKEDFDDEERFMGYGTGCHTIGDRSAWIAFSCGQVEAQWFSDTNCKNKIDFTEP